MNLPPVDAGQQRAKTAHVGISIHGIETPAGTKFAIVQVGQKCSMRNEDELIAESETTMSMLLCDGQHLQAVVDLIRKRAEENGVTIL